MLLRDRLIARMAAMGADVDYPRLAEEVIGIRGAPLTLARRLVEQALVMEDRRESWAELGRRLVAAAPSEPGVYVLRDAAGAALYVGKAVNVRRRLRSHFTAKRWASLKPALARIASAEWQLVGSELEALLREALLIRQLHPIVNVQVGPPAVERRLIPERLLRDVVTILPSAELLCAEFIAARVDGQVLVRRAARTGVDLAEQAAALWSFFQRPTSDRLVAGGAGDAAIVFSWLAGRGASATRVDPHQWGSLVEFRARLSTLLHEDRLFVERLVIV